MKILTRLFALTAVLFALSAAHAQPYLTAPSGPPPAPVTSVTAEATTGTPAQQPAVGAEDHGTMPATGGAPLIMVFGGTLIAASALFMRRRLTA